MRFKASPNFRSVSLPGGVVLSGDKTVSGSQWAPFVEKGLLVEVAEQEPEPEQEAEPRLSIEVSEPVPETVEAELRAEGEEYDKAVKAVEKPVSNIYESVLPPDGWPVVGYRKTRGGKK